MKSILYRLLALVCLLGVIVPASGQERNGGSTGTTSASVSSDTNVVRFCASNNIVDPTVVTRLNNMVTILKAYGIYSNLVDVLILKPDFNVTNALSLFGQPFTPSNVDYTMFGAHFNGTAAIRYSCTTDLRTNSLLTVWRVPPGDVQNGTSYYRSGVANSATGSGIWVGANGQDNYEWAFTQTNNIFWPVATGSIYTNIIDYYAVNDSYGYARIVTHAAERRTSVFVVNGTNYTDFEDGRPAAFNLNSTWLTLTSNIAILEPLTNVVIGVNPNANAVYGGVASPFKGEVASVMVFKTALTTNQASGATVAARCLEPDTTDDIWLGDSLFESTIGYGTNCIAWFYETRRPRNDSWNVCDWGGGKLAQMANSATSNFLFQIPTAPGVTRRIFLGAGINDIYGTGDTPQAVLGYLTNFAGTCRKAGAKLIFIDVPPTSTNYSGYTAVFDTNRAVFNMMVASNSFLLAGLTKRGAFVNQAMMKTNNASPYRYSVDGLHLRDLTNGWYAQKLIADRIIGEDDFGARPLTDYSGNLLLNGQVFTNWTGIGQ